MTHYWMPTIDAGTARQPETIIVTEKELQEMPYEELRLLERMLREPPTGVNLSAEMNDRATSRDVIITIRPGVPCITRVIRKGS